MFSPSHRNHYLNVTPNNLLRIYSPDGGSLSSTQPLPLVLVRVMTTANSNSSRTTTTTTQLSVFRLQEPDSPTAIREPVSRMQLVFDEEDEEGQEAATDLADDGPSRGVQESENTALPHSSWELGQKSLLNQAQAPLCLLTFPHLDVFLVFVQMMTWTSSWASYLRTPTASDCYPDPLYLEVASTASCCPQFSAVAPLTDAGLEKSE